MIVEPAVRLEGLRTEDAVRQVRDAFGWIPLDRLALVRVVGLQRAKFLHSLLSNDIASLTPGTSRLAALMNLKGQQVAWMRVLAEADSLVLELPLEARDRVVETLVHYKVGAPVRFEKPEAAIFGVFGARAKEALGALGIADLPATVGSFSSTPLLSSALRVSRGEDLPALGFTVHVDASTKSMIEETFRARMGEPMAVATLDTLRVEEGIPWHGIDVTEENLLHETGGMDLYHSKSKGCYLGQEVVARLEGRGGNVNKKLVGLKCAQAVSAGDAILSRTGETTVLGRVTTSGSSPGFGAIAMGYVHRTHSDLGSALQVSGIEVEVAALPFRF